MQNFKDFLLAIPFLCNVPNPERWSWIIKTQYEDELNNPDTVFKRNEYDIKNPINRLSTAFGFTSVGNEYKIDHCKKLAELTMLSHYKYYHDEKQWNDRIMKLQEDIAYYELDNPEIAKVYTVDDASRGIWET